MMSWRVRVDWERYKHAAALEILWQRSRIFSIFRFSIFIRIPLFFPTIIENIRKFKS